MAFSLGKKTAPETANVASPVAEKLAAPAREKKAAAPLPPPRMRRGGNGGGAKFPDVCMMLGVAVLFAAVVIELLACKKLMFF